uniref:Uncharacterized protein n=1 Tax=Callorhinchus milii TaxID=7868 RepID=A0A4W3GY73_CALMI
MAVEFGVSYKCTMLLLVEILEQFNPRMQNLVVLGNNFFHAFRGESQEQEEAIQPLASVLPIIIIMILVLMQMTDTQRLLNSDLEVVVSIYCSYQRQQLQPLFTHITSLVSGDLLTPVDVATASTGLRWSTGNGERSWRERALSCGGVGGEKSPQQGDTGTPTPPPHSPPPPPPPAPLDHKHTVTTAGRCRSSIHDCLWDVAVRDWLPGFARKRCRQFPLLL